MHEKKNIYLLCLCVGGYTSEYPEVAATLTECSSCGDVTPCVTVPCAADQFDCGNGECVARDRVCDNIRDCDNLADEAACPCGEDEFTCGDGGCVPAQYVCDTRPDCRDRSDEAGCPCPADTWPCDGGRCVPAAWRCNGRAECRDATDEAECEQSAAYCAVSGRWRVYNWEENL